jgi:predicted transcriptional regulator
MKESTDLEIRKKIFDLLSKNPGLNLSTIAEVLNISIPLTVYHLRYLEKQELLISIKEEGYKRYYKKEQLDPQLKKILSILRQETPFGIVLFLLKNPYSHHKEIIKNFDIAPSTLSYHLKKLTEKEIITEKVKGDIRGYVVANEKEIIKLIIQYKPSKVLKRFKDAWMDFSVR